MVFSLRLQLAKAASCHNKRHRIKELSKFILRSYIYASHFQQMVKLFINHDRKYLFIRQPNYLMKCMIPFLHVGMNKNQIIQLLDDHHSWLEHRFQRLAIEKIHTEKLYLAEIPIGDDRYPLTLSFDGKIRKEGELALSLENASGDAYYTLGFTFQNNKILIGCIQGTTNDNGFSRLFTKAVFGLRPKSFMVEALQIIAQHLAIEHIYAIKNSAHIYNAKRYNKKINLNYDQLWQEHDGTEHDQWFYALPIESKRKAMEEIKRPKRKMYRERYLWLDQFKDEMIHSLQPCLLCS